MDDAFSRAMDPSDPGEAPPSEDVSPADTGGQAVEETQTEAPSYWDPTQHAGQKTVVTVDGEQIEVDVSDLVNGYSRHSDYTRKTQAVAQKEQALAPYVSLQQALQRNPQETIAFLAAQYGLNQAPGAQEDEEEWDDPLEKQLHEQQRAFEQRFAPVEEFLAEQRATQILDHQVSQLAARYGDAFDADAVFEYAAANNRYDPNLEVIFKEMMFEKLYAQQGAAQDDAAARAADEAARRQAAAQAAGVVHSGGSAATAGSAVAPQVSSIREAYMQAKQEMGL